MVQDVLNPGRNFYRKRMRKTLVLVKENCKHIIIWAFQSLNPWWAGVFKVLCAGCCFSQVWLFVNPWTVACQARLSMGFPRQGYWSRLPYSPPGDLPHPGNELVSPALQADSLPLSDRGGPLQGPLVYYRWGNRGSQRGSNCGHNSSWDWNNLTPDPAVFPVRVTFLERRIEKTVPQELSEVLCGIKKKALSCQVQLLPSDTNGWEDSFLHFLQTDPLPSSQRCCLGPWAFCFLPSAPELSWVAFWWTQAL